MRPLLKVVAGRDLSPGPRALAEARKRARPILADWLKRVESHVLAGHLAPIDLMMARALTNCGPSANEGRCYAGQTKLGEDIGSCVRTARSSLKRLCSVGALSSKRGGPGRTASWTFCINGMPIFGGAERKIAAQDRQHLSGLDRQHVADNPSELDPVEHNPSPQSPPSAAEQAERPARGQPVKEAERSGDAVHHGEVMGPEGEIEFGEFWRSIRHNPGQPGPAIAAWAKLSREDRSAIGALIGPDGLDLGGVWAATWLKARMWTQAPVRSRMDDALDALRRYADGADSAPNAEAARAARIEMLQPYSERWHAERARKIAAGEGVKFMDARARDGKPWQVRRDVGSA